MSETETKYDIEYQLYVPPLEAQKVDPLNPVQAINVSPIDESIPVANPEHNMNNIDILMMLQFQAINYRLNEQIHNENTNSQTPTTNSIAIWLCKLCCNIIPNTIYLIYLLQAIILTKPSKIHKICNESQAYGCTIAHIIITIISITRAIAYFINNNFIKWLRSHPNSALLLDTTFLLFIISVCMWTIHEYYGVSCVKDISDMQIYNMLRVEAIISIITETIVGACILICVSYFVCCC